MTALVAVTALGLTACTPPAPPAESSLARPSLTPSTAAPQPVRAAVVPEVRSAALGEAITAPLPPPTRVEIAAAQIDVPVSPTGVRSDGSMEIPDDPSVAGWYRFGPSPGEPGNVVIAAHVDSLRFGLGPFVRMRDLPAGETVTVTTADGIAHRYTVESITHYPKAQLPTEALFVRDGRAALALVTCGGSFDETSRTYSDNVVLIATEAP